MTKTKKQLALLGALLLGFTAYMWYEAVTEPRSAPQRVALDKGAMCRAAIPMQVRFKEPASIRFDATRLTTHKDGGTHVSVELGARNGFGGYSLMACGCDILKDDSVHVTCSQLR